MNANKVVMNMCVECNGLAFTSLEPMSATCWKCGEKKLREEPYITWKIKWVGSVEGKPVGGTYDVTAESILEAVELATELLKINLGSNYRIMQAKALTDEI